MKDQLQQGKKGYFLSFNSEESLKEDKDVEDPLLDLANPNYYFHYYCHFTEELYHLVLTSDVAGLGLRQVPQSLHPQGLLSLP